MLTFIPSIGPLLKIYQKMFVDFFNFLFIYAILVIMFAMAGTVLFIFYIPEFQSVSDSLITVFSASIGAFNFAMFDVVLGVSSQTYYFGIGFTFIIVVILNIMILNLLISVLSTRYSSL